MKEKKLLSAENISISFFGKSVFKPVSFEIFAGDIVAIIGPNGSGKTTLVKALINEIPYSGSTQWAKDVKIGYVPQRFAFPGTVPLTIQEFLFSFASNAHEKNEVVELLAEVGLTGKGHSFIHTLSGGELQRLLIAKSLIQNPDVLILDEPVSGVDIEGERNFYDIVSHLHSSHNTTIIMISHEIDIVSSLATQIICLSKNYVCFGPTAETLSDKTLGELFGTDMHLHHHDHSNK